MKYLVFAAILLGAVPLAVAQDNPIATRKSIMKGVGDATKAPGGMLKGDVPFDIAPVKAALQTYSTASKRMPSLFPVDSKTGGETTAAPKIWDEKAKFDAGWTKFDTDSTTALAAITDEASFKREFPKVLGNCKTCHDDFRVKK